MITSAFYFNKMYLNGLGCKEVVGATENMTKQSCCGWTGRSGGEVEEIWVLLG